jgi:hypothetical protein
MGIVEFVLDREMKEGMEKGYKKGWLDRNHEIVTSLLINTDLEVKKIASLANVSEAYIRYVKKSMNQVSLPPIYMQQMS